MQRGSHVPVRQSGVVVRRPDQSIEIDFNRHTNFLTQSVFGRELRDWRWRPT